VKSPHLPLILRRLIGSILTLAVVLALLWGLSAAGLLSDQLKNSYGALAIGIAIALLATRLLQYLIFDLLFQFRRHIAAPQLLRQLVGLVIFGFGVALAIKLVFPEAHLGALLTTSAILTAVIGFSLQDTLGNVMGGLALQLDNSIHVGDWVKLADGTRGRVAEIRWRYTAVETRNWETVLVPNSVLTKGQVVVEGRRENQPTQLRRWVTFNVDFRFQPSDVIRAVDEAVQGAPIERVAHTPLPHCVLMELGESFGRYAVRYWLTDIAVDDGTDSVIRTRIFFALKRCGVPLSMPAHAIFLTEENHERKAEKTRIDMSRRVHALEAVDLFDDLDDATRTRLAESLHYAPFTRGEAMTRQGAEGHHLYMILQGEAAVRVATDGAEKELARLGPGTFFGEMSLMTGARRSATVVALTDVECYRLDKSAFEGVLVERPELAEGISAILASRRAGLTAAKEDLDEEARQRRLAEDKRAILHKIRDFFGLDAPARISGARAAVRPS